MSRAAIVREPLRRSASVRSRPSFGRFFGLGALAGGRPPICPPRDGVMTACTRRVARLGVAATVLAVAVHLLVSSGRVPAISLPEPVLRHPVAQLIAQRAPPAYLDVLGLSAAPVAPVAPVALGAASPAGPTEGAEVAAPVASSPAPLSPLASCSEDAVPECVCSGRDLERLNKEELLPLLDSIVTTPFFRYFKVDLQCDCPFWPDEGMCSLRDCSICECEPGEVPSPWLEAESKEQEKTAQGVGRAKAGEGEGAETKAEAETSSSSVSAPPGALSCASTVRESDVDRTLGAGVREALVAIPDWRGWHNPWMPEDADGAGEGSSAPALGSDEDEDSDWDSDWESESASHRRKYTYVNLLVNPERYTGYKGESANRIWWTVYGSPALAKRDEAEDPAQRVLYRLVSGLHASISAHLVADYLLDEATATWGPNLPEFVNRLGRPEFADRVANLRFTYLFVLRALVTAEPTLRHASLATGSPEADADAEAQLARLLDAAKAVCTKGFAPGAESGPLPEPSPELFAELRDTFRNVTRVLDCVGCEKCKTWGKLQFLGLATSLKLLLPETRGELPVLERNEAIALVNLAERLGNSVEMVRTLTIMATEQGLIPNALGTPWNPANDAGNAATA